MSYFNQDTIAAIATASEMAAAVGVIRVSGEKAWEISEKVLRKKSGAKFSSEELESHKLYRANIVDPLGKLLDDGMFVWMKGPNSFTGENVVELNLHGSPRILRMVTKELIQAGARQAFPGEFSFRAFRNGKLSLDQAEAVTDLIHSQSEESARRALGQLIGVGKSQLEELKKFLVDRLAEVEIDIDFSDQGLSQLNYDLWKEKLNSWVERIETIREEFTKSQPLRDGIRLAIVGAPNSGKSSIFNRLLGEERSIVSDIEGTTRDVVREALSLKGILFRLADTAGIRSTGDLIETKGIERSFGEVQTSQAVLWVLDGAVEDGSGLEKRWAELSKNLPESAKVCVVWNKCDENPKISGAITTFLQKKSYPIVACSARTGEGIASLIDALTGQFALSELGGQDFFLSRWRHFEVLGGASEAVRAAVAKVESGEKYPDLLAIDLRTALSKVGEITGEVHSEDLLNHIFAEFCIGK
jgi:tRNA modification GTPase